MPANTRKTKVLFRLRSLEMGGVQKVVLDLLQHLPTDKFEFTLLVNMNQGVLRNEIPSHVRYFYIAKGREDMSKNKFLKWWQLAVRNLEMRYYKNNPKKLYAKLGINNMDVEIASSYSELEDVLNSPLKSKKIGWFHTDIRFVETSLAKKFIARLHRFDAVIFGAKQTRDVINEHYQEVFPKGKVIYNVIDKELIDEKSKAFEMPHHSTPVFVSVARLQKRKGFDKLMTAHKQLIDEGFDHQVYVIGDGDYKETLQQKFQELKLDQRFQFLGTLKNPYPYVKNADYFVLPSKTESYPLIIGEALCLGTPIISTDVGGINEMIDDNVDGMLINPKTEEIYKAMKRFLTDAEYVSKLRENAKSSYQKFDKQKIYDQVTATILELSHER